MTDGLWKYHLKKAHQVELPEVGLPEGIRRLPAWLRPCPCPCNHDYY